MAQPHKPVGGQGEFLRSLNPVRGLVCMLAGFCMHAQVLGMGKSPVPSGWQRCLVSQRCSQWVQRCCCHTLHMQGQCIIQAVCPSSPCRCTASPGCTGLTEWLVWRHQPARELHNDLHYHAQQPKIHPALAKSVNKPCVPCRPCGRWAPPHTARHSWPHFAWLNCGWLAVYSTIVPAPFTILRLCTWSAKHPTPSPSPCRQRCHWGGMA